MLLILGDEHKQHLEYLCSASLDGKFDLIFSTFLYFGHAPRHLPIFYSADFTALTVSACLKRCTVAFSEFADDLKLGS